MKEYQEILACLINGKENWSQLKQELSKYNISQAKESGKDTRAGKIFEVFTKYYFLTSPTDKDNFKNVWLFEEIPLVVRDKLKLGNQDYGVDLVLQDMEDQFFVVQCKYKNDELSRLNWTADRIANLFAFCPNANGYIVFSNAVDLDTVSKTRHDNFTFYNIANLNEIEKVTIESIHALLTEKQLPKKKQYDPLPHQQTAIEECVQWFTEGNESRGQLIMPCGAGKTFTALRIKERLHSKNTLVLVPSLALVRQIKNEWAKQRTVAYQYLCVCSEVGIDNDIDDTMITHTYEIDTRVTTDINHVKSFLQKTFNEKVIFSTYHSLVVISDAIKDLNFEFDLTFCDEAHKTAGIGNGMFSLVHDNSKIPSKYRLYSTATPRIVKESLKKQIEDDLNYAYDMNDPNIFGYEFYRMSFKEAIEKKILVDYKIVVIGVNDVELQGYINERRYVNDKHSIDEIANNYALDHVMRKYNAKYGLTFHSRVKLAKEFTERHSKLFPDIKAFFVSGEQSTSYRNTVLEDFKNADSAIVSNARCLTEGVDVPTIELIFFCDPKNSKIDIVQAAGRALRRKEDKALGYIVVPIYHSKKYDVENSISTSSFKNLLQVIRSLCDQDERLQDEINSIGFGKEMRSIGRLDVIYQHFISGQDTIILDGFEEKLRNSLFDQIIEKSSNNWDLRFLELKEFLRINGEYPTKKHDSEIYSWVTTQRIRKNNGTLRIEELRKLNSINFEWNIIEQKWERMFDKFREYAAINEFPPCQGIDDDELVKWYRIQKNYINDKKIISKENSERFVAIENKFQGPSSRKKWALPYENLIRYRQENPSQWPIYDPENSKSEESQLNVFCQIMRKRYRSNKLENYWFEKLITIDFNFEGRTDDWTQTWKEIKELLDTRNSITSEDLGNNVYSWILRYKRKYDEGALTDYHTKKIEELNLDRFFETWEQKFSKVKNWKDVNGRLPTKTSEKNLHSWLSSQRIRYNNNRLTESQIQSLILIEYDLNAKGYERMEERWNEMFENVRSFKEENNKWPSFGVNGLEAQLYNWCQGQRQAQAGTHSGGRRKALKQWQAEKLNSINFHWSLLDLNNVEWESKYQELEEFLSKQELGELKSGTKLWRWIYNQNLAFEKGGFDESKKERLLVLGIDITKRISSDGKDGFMLWAKNIIKIGKFIEENGYYPTARKDELQNKLYNSLAKARRAYKNNELSVKQLKLISDLNINLDN
ncbi:Helicase associated domain protein [Chitinophaga sancti]|uniref:DEAD/DEAH box helicase n=1 Tax=Chitinophaga sancti TaxID=1004 RepID=UPI002A747352|nr:Helicase associated domain protein [Chitinophaga sancti]WPQ63814.1 Helicase associated domain protein [Chitinophaga sancti]